MKRRVFLIAINYNGLSDTLEFIDSVKKINYQNYQIIIVDNASNKEDVSVIDCIEGVTLLRAEENLGFSGGNNLGIMYALEHGADYIVLINNDTLVEPDFLTHAVDYLDQHSDVGIVTGKIMYEENRNHFWFAGGKLNYLRGRAYHYGSNEEDLGQYDQTQQISFCTGCLMVIPVEALKIVGPMREDYFLYYEDTEYSARFTENKYKMVYLPSVKIYHKVSASTGGGSVLYHYYNWRNRLYFIEEHVHGWKKFPAYLFYMYESVKRIALGDISLCVYLRAVRDYLYRVKGKVIL